MRITQIVRMHPGFCKVIDPRGHRGEPLAHRGQLCALNRDNAVAVERLDLGMLKGILVALVQRAPYRAYLRTNPLFTRLTSMLPAALQGAFPVQGPAEPK